MDWAGLEQAVAEGDRAKALLLALDGWRLQKHPRFGDLVEAMGKGVAPFAARGDFHAAWLAAAAVVDDVGPLVATLARSLPQPDDAYRWPPIPNARRYAAWLERVDALAKRRADPRIASAVLEVVALASWSSMASDGWAALIDPAVKLVVETGDPRSAERMKALLDKPIAKKQGMRQLLAEAFPPAIAAIETAALWVEVSESELARVDALIGPAKMATSSDDEDALFALVTGDLESDEPRLVLADHWLERENPRGEFITQQLAGNPPKNLRKYEKEWLGELALVTKNRVWARGFLTQIELANNAAADPAVWELARASRELQTVERIEKGKANEAIFLAFVAAARGLRTLTPASKKMAMFWADAKEPWPVTHLELAFKVDVKLARTLIASRAFPHVEKVSFGAKNIETLMAVARAFAGAGVRKLAVLAGHVPVSSASELGDFLAEPFDGAERAIDVRPWSYLVVRGGAPLRLEATCGNLYYVSAALERFRFHQIPVAAISLRLPPGVDVPQPPPNAVARALLEGIALDADQGWSVALGEAG